MVNTTKEAVKRTTLRYKKSFVHAVFYCIDLLGNVLLRYPATWLGVVPLGVASETISSGMGKSYSLDYVYESEVCNWCRWVCLWIITPTEKALLWALKMVGLYGGPLPQGDHCERSINPKIGLRPRGERGEDDG